LSNKAANRPLTLFATLIRRFCWYDRAADLQRFHQLPVVMVCALLVGKLKSEVQLKLSEPLSFPKSNALRTAGIGFEIAFHQLQSLRVLLCGIRNNAIGRDS
jgi:hypothetical protein